MNRAVLISCPSHLEATDSRMARTICFVAGAAAEQAADVGLLEGEQAVAELAVGGQADPVAAHAEGAADRGDHADASAAINVVIIDGRGARVLVRGGNQRSDLPRQPVKDLGGEEDLLTFPQSAIQRHVLDEPHFQPVLPGEPGERNNVLLGARPSSPPR